MNYCQNLMQGHPCSTRHGFGDLRRTRRTSPTASYRTAAAKSIASVRRTQPAEICTIQTPSGTEVRSKVKAKTRPVGRDPEGGNERPSNRETSMDMPSPSPHVSSTETRRPWAIEVLSRPERHRSSATVPSIIAEQRTPVDMAVHHTPVAVGRILGPACDGLPCRAPELKPRPVQASVLFHMIVAHVQASWHIFWLADILPPCCRRSSSGSTAGKGNFLHIMSIRWCHSNSPNILYRRARGSLTLFTPVALAVAGTLRRNKVGTEKSWRDLHSLPSRDSCTLPCLWRWCTAGYRGGAR